MILSPKYHPEVARVDIEYSRGMSKPKLWREINDEKPSNLHRIIKASMCPNYIPTVRETTVGHIARSVRKRWTAARRRSRRYASAAKRTLTS